MYHGSDLCSPQGLGRRNVDGGCARSSTEVIIEARPAGRQLVAASTASAAVAKPDIARCGEALRARSLDARRAAVVDDASASADVCGATVAVRDHNVLGCAGSEWVDWLADVGELRIRRSKPVHHLVVADDVARDLRRKVVSTTTSRACS